MELKAASHMLTLTPILAITPKIPVKEANGKRAKESTRLEKGPERAMIPSALRLELKSL